MKRTGALDVNRTGMVGVEEVLIWLYLLIPIVMILLFAIAVKRQFGSLIISVLSGFWEQLIEAPSILQNRAEHNDSNKTGHTESANSPPSVKEGEPTYGTDGGNETERHGTAGLNPDWLPLVTTHDGVRIEKSYRSDEPYPTVELKIESEREEPLRVRLREPVPIDFDLELIHFPTQNSSDANSEMWERHSAGSYIEYRAELDSQATVVTGYGLDTTAEERIEQFLRQTSQFVSVTPVATSKHEDTTEESESKPTSGKTESRPEPDHPAIESPPPLTFDDVAGFEDVKSSLQTKVIDPFENPAYEQYDIGKINGVLFYGPPGTGKTYLAEALAGELGYNYIQLNTSDIVSTTVGESVERLEELFTAAQEYQPCLLFFDELDAITSDRNQATMTQHQHQTVSTMLEWVADINESDENVLVVAATNRPDALDSAMKRTGRFDTTIKIGIPDADTRLAILEHHLKSRGPPAEELFLDSEFCNAFATRSAGLSASDVTEVAESAHRLAIRSQEETPYVRESHVFKALEDVREKREQDIVGEFIAETPDLSFADVGGLDEVKSTLEKKVIDALDDPDRYEQYGLDPPTGILLYGPPGTGKTYLSRAVAGEADVTYLSVSGSDILSKWVGEAAENIRKLIERAEATQPCILFIDELDAIAGQRSATGMSHSEASMVNELLTGLSKLDDEDVIVIATTNRPDKLDDAVTRSGRMDERFEISPPDAEARVEILKVQLRDRPVDLESIDWTEIAELTAPNKHSAPLVASDLEQLVNKAAHAAMNEAAEETIQHIEQRHLERAIRAMEPSLSGPHYDEI
jgi:SpoVK/Ycf46/Vps4 family AAA+-type ATPase